MFYESIGIFKTIACLLACKFFVEILNGPSNLSFIFIFSSYFFKRLISSCDVLKKKKKETFIYNHRCMYCIDYNAQKHFSFFKFFL